MFSSDLTNLKLASDIANDFFPNIYGDSYGGECSFLATLRALVAPRISENDELNLRVSFYHLNEPRFVERGERESVEELSQSLNSNTISIAGFSGTGDNMYKALKAVDNFFLKIYPEYEELKDIRAFVAKQADMRFFISHKNKSSIVFVAGLNLRLYHLVQSFTSRLLPWFFKDNPLNEEEKSLVKSLTLKTSTDYERLIELWAAKYDFRGKKIDNMLVGFEKAAKQAKLSAVSDSLLNKEDEIKRNIAQYRTLLMQRDHLMLERDGLVYQTETQSVTLELSEYFRCNKHLDLLLARETSIDFIVSCYLENYDTEIYERVSNNFDSYMYNSAVTNSVFENKLARKKLMDAIFSDDPILKVKLCGYYCINLLGYVSTLARYDYPIEHSDSIPNPHLQLHGCLGQQRPLIEECLRNGNFIGAIEQCICSAQSINVGESMTFVNLPLMLFSSDAKNYIELPDGTSCTPSEALAWLDKREINAEVNE